MTLQISAFLGANVMAEMVNPDREVTVRPSYFSLNYFINK